MSHQNCLCDTLLWCMHCWCWLPRVQHNSNQEITHTHTQSCLINCEFHSHSLIGLLTHLLIHPLTHYLLIHSLTHPLSLIHTPTPSLIHSLTHPPLSLSLSYSLGCPVLGKLRDSLLCWIRRLQKINEYRARPGGVEPSRWCGLDDRDGAL